MDQLVSVDEGAMCSMERLAVTEWDVAVDLGTGLNILNYKWIKFSSHMCQKLHFLHGLRGASSA